MWAALALAGALAAAVRTRKRKARGEMGVRALLVYPVKGCKGIQAERCAITARGLAYDRAFVVVYDDPNSKLKNGKFVSQRGCPQLARVHVRIPERELLLEKAPGAVMELSYKAEDGGGKETTRTLEVPLAANTSGRLITAKVWGTEVEGHDCGDAAAEFFSHVCAAKVRLLRFPDDGGVRHCDPKYVMEPSGNGAVVGHTAGAFCDGFPLLACLDESIASMSKAMCRPYAEVLERFRPNVVFEGGYGAYADDGFAAVQCPLRCTPPSGGDETIRFLYAKPCARCTVPLVHPGTGKQEPGVGGVSAWDALKAERRRGAHIIPDAPASTRNDLFWGWNCYVSVPLAVDASSPSWWGFKLGELVVGDRARVVGRRRFRLPF